MSYAAFPPSPVAAVNTGIVRVTLTPADTITPDLSVGQDIVFTLALDRDSVIANPINAGSITRFMLIIEPQGPFAPTFGDSYRLLGGGYVPTTVAGARDALAFIAVDGACVETTRGQEART